MSVISQNPYDILTEEFSVLAPQKSEKKGTSILKKDEKKNEPRTRSDYPQRGGKKVVPVPRAETRREYSDRDFSAAKQGRGGRFDTASRGGFSGRGREFDRKSASGKVDSEKKIHQSWGDAGTDIQEGKKGYQENRGDATRLDSQVDKLNTSQPEDRSKTLEEYYAEKTNKSTTKSLPQARKPNEGVDENQWKDSVPLEKEEAEYFATSNNKKSKGKKEKKDKIFVGIEQRFTDTRGSGFEGRGPSGRGTHNSGLNVHDKSAFPSLG